jgi:hypothetical protein
LVTVPTATIRPAGNTGENFANARQILNAGGTARSAVGRKPLATTNRANHCSCSAAIRNPMSDPQS